MKLGNLMNRVRGLIGGAKPQKKETPPSERKTGCLLATLGITFRCMCSCAHCGSGKYAASAKDEMPTEELKGIIKQLRENGANSINFFGGEPLVRKDLPELIAYAKSFGMGTAMDCNGYLLDRDMAATLAKAELDMAHISIDSADPKKHDEMRGVKGIFDRAINAIKYCKEAGIAVRIGAYVDRERLNSGEFARLIELGKQVGAPLRVLTPVLTGKWQDAVQERLTPEEVVKFRTMLAPGVAYWEQESCNGAEASFVCACIAKDYIYITAYGDVTPCVYVPLSFGNARKEPLAQILERMWAHELFKRDTCNKCITNTSDFREKYVNLNKNNPGKYPVWIG